MRKRKIRNKLAAALLSALLAVSAVPGLPAEAAGHRTAENILPTNHTEYSLAETRITSYENGRIGANTYFADHQPSSKGLDMAAFIQPDPVDPDNPPGTTEDYAGRLVRTVNNIKVLVRNADDYVPRDYLRIDPTGEYDSALALNDLMSDRLMTADGTEDTNAWTLVYIPAGKYKLDYMLTIPKRTWLYLEEGATLVRSDPSIPMAMESYAGTATAAVGGYERVTGIVIEGGVWDGGNANRTDGENFSNMILLRHGREISIRNATFQNCIGHILDLSGDRDVLVENCTFDNMPDYTGNSSNYYTDGQSDSQKKSRRLYTEAVHFDFMNEKGEPGDISDGTPCANCTVRNCTFQNCQRGVGTHHVITTTWGEPNYSYARADQFSILNNTFIGCKSEPISLFSYQNVVVANCTADTDRFFAEIKDCRDILITDCSTKKSTDKSFTISNTEDIVITGFTSKKNEGGVPAVYLENVKRAAVEKSVFAASSGVGVSLKGSSNIYIYQNQITGSTGSAVRVDSSSAVTVRGNRISGGSLYGIEFTAGSSGIILGNVISNMKYHGISLRGNAAAGCSAEIYYNTVDTCVGRGIIMVSAGGTIRGNIIMNIANESDSVKSNGIHIENCYGTDAAFRIEDNFIQNCVNAGIRITNTPGVRIAGNTMTKTGSTGIHAGSCDKSEFVNNTAFNDAGAWANVFVQNSAGVTAKDNKIISSGQSCMLQDSSGSTSLNGKNGNGTASWYYSDVSQSNWSGEYLLFCRNFGTLISGSNGKFNPKGKNITRRDFAVILYNVMGKPAVSGTNNFYDADQAAYANDAIIWANQNGVVTGYSGAKEGFFGCKDNIKRYQLALMMFRLAKKLGYDTSARGDLTKFPDLSQSFFSDENMAEQREALSWAVGTGIITGKNGKMAKGDTATRQECATMITRFIKAYPELAGSSLTYENP